MRILVTNDDGIFAPGIALLAEKAKDFGEVTVVAPRNQCSAMSHHITLGEKMRLRKEDFPVPGVEAYSLEGTPADCVRFVMRGQLIEKPDLLLSGINDGANCGVDTLYSATVGAAMEAVLYRVPAICFSQLRLPETSHEIVNRMILPIMEELIQEPLSDGYVWNVNFPACSYEDFQGILRNRVLDRDCFFEDVYEANPLDEESWDVRLIDRMRQEAIEGTDIAAVLSGHISIGKIQNMVF